MRSASLGGQGKNTYTGGPESDVIHAVTTEPEQGAKEVINAGAGNDTIFTDDSMPDQIKCGEDTDGGDIDTLHVDLVDSVPADCENVVYP